MTHKLVNRRSAAILTAVLTLGVAGPAVARPIDSVGPYWPYTAVQMQKDLPAHAQPATPVNRAPAAVYSRPDRSLIPVTTPHGGRTAGDATAQQAVVRIQVPQSGFDWGDAGIGAAGGIALSMIGLGGALAVSQTRARRPRRTTALPS